MGSPEAPSGPTAPSGKPTPEGVEVEGFAIERLVGSGGSGTVYAARDEVLEINVALKVVQGLEGTHLSRFEREAELHTQLDHPGIVRAYRWGREGAKGWIAFELLDGADLSRYVRTELSVEHRLGLLAQVARALHYGHEQGVIHRDIKPANIFLASDGRVLLLDFGVAKLPDKPLTATGRLVGTPAYMAPEYILETPVDHRADVFGLGVVAFQLLTGSRPWVANEAHTLLVRICTTPAARFEDRVDAAPVPISPEVVPAMAAVIHRAISHDPKRRQASAAELANDFETLLSGGFDDVTATRQRPETAAADRLAWARARAARIQAEAQRATDIPDSTRSDATRAMELTATSNRAFWMGLVGLLAGAVVVLLVIVLAGLM
ncbi:MAG: serine/threonine-protein kinase [Myxococcota bacterium]